MNFTTKEYRHARIGSDNLSGEFETGFTWYFGDLGEGKDILVDDEYNGKTFSILQALNGRMPIRRTIGRRESKVAGVGLHERFDLFYERVHDCAKYGKVLPVRIMRKQPYTGTNSETGEKYETVAYIVEILEPVDKALANC